MSQGIFHRLKAALARIDGRRGLWLVSVLLAIAAVAVWTDKPGLEARYFSHLDERPVLVRTDDWLAIDPDFAASTFYFRRIFSVEWSGWLEIERGGEYRFRITSTGPARLTIDGGDAVVGGLERRRKAGRRRLEPGLHRVEMRFDHVGREILFDLELRGPRGEWGAVPAHRLYDRRPGAAGRWLRRATGGTSSVERKLAATILLVLAFGAASRAAARSQSWRTPRRLLAWAAEPRRRRRLLGAGLGLLFVVAVTAVLPRTGSPFGWDDVRYLDMAAFDRGLPWVINRYAHVYLLDLFIWLARGDAFLGARYFWSIQFGVIVCSLALCAAFLGPKLQLATFWTSLFLLFCQPLYFLRAGASVPDTTVGTLVLAAVALYLHRWRRGPPAPRAVEWQILLIGVVTVWAFKSKELGIILLWLVVLFVFEKGRPDWRGFARKIAYWSLGVVVGLASLALLDAIYFGDPLYGLRPSHQREVTRFNLAEDPQQIREKEGWTDIVKGGRTPVATNNPRMRYMALLVVASALLAGWKKRSIELRLLHFLPVLYFLMLTVIHVRATYIFLVRYLYPVVPVSCFLVAAAFHYLGIDDLGRGEVRSPRFFVPALLLAFLVVGVVVPYQGYWIEAGEFLPAQWLESRDWRSLDAFVHLVATPILILILVLALALFQRHRPTRLLLTATLVALVLAVPFSRTLWELRTRRAWQRGETNLHGLRVLGHEVPRESGIWLAIFAVGDRMFGEAPTCERITKVYLRRDDLRVSCWPDLYPEQDAALLSLQNYRAWLKTWPELERTAVFSPAGELVLVRPSQAAPPAARR